MSESHCESIAQCRRSIHGIDKKRVPFLDETAVRVNAVESHTLVAPGETAYVVAEDDTAYAHRYDMIACCTIDRTFPPIVFSPEDRQARGVKGITSEMIEEYIHTVLAQALAALDRRPLSADLGARQV